MAKEAARNKKVRSQLSEEEKGLQREKTRLRFQNLRQRRRDEKQTEVQTQFHKKVKDMTGEELKEYDRVKKAGFRAKMNHQKKEFVKENRNIERTALQRKNSF